MNVGFAGQKKKLNAGRAKSMNKFVEALLVLMRTQPFADITITDLSEQAKLVRKTFYRNFDSKEAIVEYKFDTIFDEIAQKFDFSESCVGAIFEFCFELLKKDSDFTRVFVDEGLHSVVTAKIKECIETAFIDTLHSSVSFEPTLAEFYTTFIADGMVSVITTWVKGGRKQSPGVMAKLTRHLLSGVIA